MLLRKRKDAPTEPPKTTDSKRVKKDPPANNRMKYTDDQRHWICLHYHLLSRAVSNRPLRAPPGPSSCAYFNAYWQGFMTPTKEPHIPKTMYPKRIFRNFDQMRRGLLPDVVEQIETTLGGETDENAREFTPVITPARQAEYITLFNNHHEGDGFNWSDKAGIAELHNFLDNMIEEQLAPPKRTWQEAGRRNLLSRDVLNLRGYTTQYKLATPLDENTTISGLRVDWHRDPNRPRDPKDFFRAFNPATGREEHIEMRRRELHAAAGNALLNMAALQPRGYNGDMRSLVKDPKSDDCPEMTIKQQKRFFRHIDNVQTGKELQGQIFREAEATWPQPEGDRAKVGEGIETVESKETVENEE
jgi:hypothetical protein